LRILRQDITLEETAPAGLKEPQKFLQNHFKREFAELYKDNPQQLAQIKASPWFKFHAFLPKLPEPSTQLTEEPIKKDEPSNSQTEQTETSEPSGISNNNDHEQSQIPLTLEEYQN